MQTINITLKNCNNTSFQWTSAKLEILFSGIYSCHRICTWDAGKNPHNYLNTFLTLFQANPHSGDSNIEASDPETNIMDEASPTWARRDPAVATVGNESSLFVIDTGATKENQAAADVSEGTKNICVGLNSGMIV